MNAYWMTSPEAARCAVSLPLQGRGRAPSGGRAALKRCRLLAVAIAGFALATSAHAASNAAQPSATTHAASAATKTGTKAATTAKSSKSKTTHKTAASHATGRTTRTRTASAEPASGADTAYRAALRHCVTGPASQRDGCIDDAIARYGHA